MDRRAIAAVALLALAGCSGGSREHVSLANGATVPSEWLPPSAQDGPGVVWVFRTNDCLTCQSLDYSIRRMQRVHREVPLTTVHVGKVADAEIPRAFFRNRRLAAASAVDVPPGEFRRTYGDVTFPVLLIRRGDRITWSSAGGSQPRLTEQTIDSLFNAHITSPDVPVVAPPSNSARGGRE